MAKKKLSIRDLQEYMEERELTRIRKERGDPWPWTKDKIIQKYKFTNVHRSDDYTTKQFLGVYLSHVMPFPETERAAAHDVGMMLYNAAVARYFGTAEFYTALGWQSSFDPRDILKLVTYRQEMGSPVFTRAYVITNGGKSMPKQEYVVQDVLAPLWNARLAVAEVALRERSWEATFNRLTLLPGFGGMGFMAKEVLQDVILVYPRLFTDARSWSPVGPGARRGLNRVLRRPVDAPLGFEKSVKEVQRLHEALDPWWYLRFQRDLSAHDVQFVLCEFDKYQRAKEGGRPKNTYTPRKP